MAVDKALLLEAINMMSNTMVKILKVNLSAERYAIVKCHPVEETIQNGCTVSIRNWFENLVKLGIVHNEDSDKFLQFVNMHALRKYFYTNDRPLTFNYRRKVQGYDDYRWVKLQFMKCERASSNALWVWMIVQDIHDNHVEELAYWKLLEYTSSHDDQTGLKNAAEYRRMASEFNSRIHAGSAGVACVSMIGLNLINKFDGHDIGDKAIEQFARELKKHFHDYECYRISGDEFLVVDLSERSTLFEMTVSDFKDKLQWEKTPAAAVGWGWQTNPRSLEAVTRIAKASMQANKDAIYKHNEQMGYSESSIEYSFKKGMMRAMAILAEDYNSVYWIDLERDTYHIFKKDHCGVQFEPPIQDKGSYSATYSRIVDKLVEKNQAIDVMEDMDIMSLRQMFDDEDVVEFDVNLITAETRHVTISKLDTHNGRVIKLLIQTKKIPAPKTAVTRPKIKKQKKSSLWDIIEKKIN